MQSADNAPAGTFRVKLAQLCARRCWSQRRLTRFVAASASTVGTWFRGSAVPDMREALALMSKGRINPASMITHIGGLDAVVNATGAPPRVMRPPYGGLLKRQRELVRSEFGYPIILWSVDPLDWKRPGPSVVTSRILHGTRAGGIVLAHDLHAQTVDAMPATLDGLLRRGFQFVTVSQLLAMKTDAAATPAAAKPSHT